MTDQNESSAPPKDTLNIVDPLGEIRRRARQLWKEDGSPTSKTWENYWEQAEQEVLGRTCFSSEAPSARKKAKVESAKPLPPHLQTLIDISEDRLCTVLASSLGRHLIEHEAVCLAHVLKTCRIRYTDNSEESQADNQRIASLLAQLVKEYDADFVKANKAADPWGVPLEKRNAYWSEKVQDLFFKDEPLTYADRNTINRLKDEIAANEQVSEIFFEAAPIELG